MTATRAGGSISSLTREADRCPDWQVQMICNFIYRRNFNTYQIWIDNMPKVEYPNCGKMNDVDPDKNGDAKCRGCDMFL